MLTTLATTAISDASAGGQDIACIAYTFTSLSTVVSSNNTVTLRSHYMQSSHTCVVVFDEYVHEQMGNYY